MRGFAYVAKWRGQNGGGSGGFAAEPPSRYQPACKGGAGFCMWRRGKPRHVTAIPLGRRLPGASSNLPGRPIADTRSRLRLAAKLAPSLFGLAPGGVCPAAFVAEDAVRSYRTFSPLPAFTLTGFGRRFVLCGTVPEIGAPRGSLSPAGRYPAPYVHGARTFLPCGLSALARAAVRPTDATEVGGFGREIKRARFYGCPIGRRSGEGPPRDLARDGRSRIKSARAAKAHAELASFCKTSLQVVRFVCKTSISLSRPTEAPKLQVVLWLLVRRTLHDILNKTRTWLSAHVRRALAKPSSRSESRTHKTRHGWRCAHLQQQRKERTCADFAFGPETADNGVVRNESNEEELTKLGPPRAGVTFWSRKIRRARRETGHADATTKPARGKCTQTSPTS